MEQEQELNAQNATIVETETEVKTEVNSSLEDFPRLEDLLKSEKEISTEQKLEGLTSVQTGVDFQDKSFARKKDKKKELVKKRLKVVTCVYGVVLSLLLAFVGVNLVTLIGLNRDIDKSVETIQSESKIVEMYKDQATTPGNPTDEFVITLNKPRDYSKDKKELTFLDKITILFQNLFG